MSRFLSTDSLFNWLRVPVTFRLNVQTLQVFGNNNIDLTLYSLLSWALNYLEVILVFFFFCTSHYTAEVSSGKNTQAAFLQAESFCTVVTQQTAVRRWLGSRVLFVTAAATITTPILVSNQTRDQSETGCDRS